MESKNLELQAQIQQEFGFRSEPVPAFEKSKRISALTTVLLRFRAASRYKSPILWRHGARDHRNRRAD